jgi:hypothetical protein
MAGYWYGQLKMDVRAENLLDTSHRFFGYEVAEIGG